MVYGRFRVACKVLRVFLEALVVGPGFVYGPSWDFYGFQLTRCKAIPQVIPKRGPIIACTPNAIALLWLLNL